MVGAIVRFVIFIVMLILSACSVAAWDNTSRDRCDEERIHDNGRWSHQFCRQGQGFMVWLDFTV